MIDQAPEEAAGVPIDAHVHCHPIFSQHRFLQAAAENFSALGSSSGIRSSVAGVLVLTQAPGEDSFSRLQQALQGGSVPEWKLTETDESISFLAERSDGTRLLFVAGVQLVSREGLEALGIGTFSVPSRRLSLRRSLRSIREAGGLAVLPWGFGKWWARRGRVVLDTLESESPSDLFVADSGVRPQLSPRPRLLILSERLGFRTLPGSDPLPVGGEESRPGSFGSLVATHLPAAKPATHLIDQLNGEATLPRPFGGGTSFPQFVRLQSVMLWRKHLPSHGRRTRSRPF